MNTITVTPPAAVPTRQQASSEGRGRGSNPSPNRTGGALDTAAASFRLLVTGPQPLAVDGERIGYGLPARSIPLDELKRLLLARATSYRARDAAWRVLVMKARQDGPAWVLGAVGVAIPGLRRAAARMTSGRPHYAEDLDAALLAGFVDALHSLDCDEGRICSRLVYAAVNAARRLQRAEEAELAARHGQAGSQAPPQVFGHPDFILARAVRAQVITAFEADLIGRTRLEDQSLADVARELGTSVVAVKMRRHRAENRLVFALANTDLGSMSDPDIGVSISAVMPSRRRIRRRHRRPTDAPSTTTAATQRERPQSGGLTAAA